MFSVGEIDMFKQYLIISLLVILVRMTWHTGQRVDVDRFIEYMHEDPEAYRLWDHILLHFHRRPFSIITLETLSFSLCVLVSYLLIMPTGLDGLLFLVGVLACSSNFSVRHSVQYPLLALLALTSSPFLLVPLILTKELAAWLGLGYLILTNGFQPLIIILAGVAFMVYLIMRRIIGTRQRVSGGAPLFAIPYYVKYMQGKIEGKNRVTILWNVAGVCAMVVFLIMRGPFILLWVAVPVFLFALWWEPQLWFPTVVVVLGGGLI